MTFTSFWIVTVDSVDETTDDNRELAVEGVVILVGVVVDAVVIGNSVARGLSQITLRLPLDPPATLNSFKKVQWFLTQTHKLI